LLVQLLVIAVLFATFVSGIGTSRRGPAAALFLGVFVTGWWAMECSTAIIDFFARRGGRSLREPDGNMIALGIGAGLLMVLVEVILQFVPLGNVGAVLFPFTAIIQLVILGVLGAIVMRRTGSIDLAASVAAGTGALCAVLGFYLAIFTNIEMMAENATPQLIGYVLFTLVWCLVAAGVGRIGAGIAARTSG
jgi:hypothetical protein